MPFADDAAAFFADFSVMAAVTSAGVTVNVSGIFDVADVGVFSDEETTASYQFTAKTTDVSGIKRGDAFVINGENYTARRPARRVDDGVFSVVVLSKV